MEPWDFEDNSSDFEIYNPEGFLPDVIVQWPVNCDYPIWRYFIKTHRPKFNKVIIAFTETYTSEDYREFVKNAMKDDRVTFFDSGPVPAGADWRNIAVNMALALSTSEWVWFTEQDFFPMGAEFWNEIYTKFMAGFDLMGVVQGTRLHPCSIFVKRSVIEQTRKDFGIIPDVSDHFSKFQADVERLKIRTSYLANEEIYQYKHLNGFSHNWRLVQEGGEPVYKPDEFERAIRFSLALDGIVDLSEEWRKVALDYLKRIGKN